MGTMTTTKYQYLYVVQGNYGYGHGWEDLTASEDRREMVADLHAYRENEGGHYHQYPVQYRIIQRRVLRDAD